MKNLKQRFISTEKYRERYRHKCEQWKQRPISDQGRSRNDTVCLLICFVFFVIFVTIGVYYITIATQDDGIQYNTISLLSKQSLDDGIQPDFTDLGIDILNKYIVQILLCIGGSIILGVIYTILLKLASKFIIYFMIFATTAVLLYLTFICLITQDYFFSASFAILTIFYSVIMICYRQQIKIGVVLIKIASKFMLQKKIIFVAIFIKLILTLIFSLFWMYGLSAITQQMRQKSQSDQDTTFLQVLVGFWTILLGYFTLILYYMMVFNIAVVFSNWYYEVQQRFPLTLSWKLIFKYSLGSFAFAAFIVSIAKLFCSILDSRKKYTKNCIAAVVLKIVKCIFKQITKLLEVLNHNAVITIAVTGQSFIEAAKTTLGLINQQFAVVSIISKLLFLWGWVFSIGVPILIGYTFIGNNLFQTLLITLVIVYFTTLITGLILSILLQCLSCVLMFYCFDKRFRQIGYMTHRMPSQMSLALAKTDFQPIDHYMLIRG